MVEKRDDARIEGPGKNSGFLHQKMHGVCEVLL